MRLAYATEGQADPYAGFEARVVPENVTLLGKTKEQATGGHAINERVHVVKKGESVSTILRDAGALPDEIKAIAAQLGARGRDGGLKEGQKLRMLMMPPGPGRKPQAVRVIVANENAAEAVVALSDLGKYVNVDVASLNTPTTTAEVASDDDDDDDGTGVRLYQSIYETALRNKVPATVIEDMIRVYSYDVDFQRRVQAGDLFEVYYRRRRRHPKPRRQERGAVRLADGRRRNQEILPLPDAGRRGRRLLRRDRQEREEVPGPQARQQRDDALGLRLAQDIRSSATRACIPASTGPPATARRSSPPATA